MSKNLLIIPLMLSCSCLFAQKDSVLKNFKFRINHYQAITIGINQNAEYGKTKYPVYNAENSSTSGNLYAAFSTIRSTDRLQLSITASAGTNISFLKNKNQTDKISNTVIGANGSFYILGRWFNDKNSFVEAGTALYGFSNNQKTKFVTTAETDKYTTGNYHFTIYTGAGIGRLENITDMQNALWLSKTLRESSRFTRELTSEELTELGRSITNGNNTRVLDARKRTQFILETVDDFLQSKSLISKTDIKYFSNLNDILFFAQNTPRLSGTEKFIRFTPDLWVNNSISLSTPTDNKSTIRPQSKSVLVSIGFNTFKPLNLIHQNNYGAAVKLNYIDYTSTNRSYQGGVLQTESNQNNIVRQAGVDLFFTHAIYPNTRTIIQLTAETEMGWQNDDVLNKNFYETTSVSAKLDYFISYRTRLFVNAGVSHNKNYYLNYYQVFQLKPDRFNASLNTGLTINL